MDSVSVLLADDHPIFLEGIGTILAMIESVKIVGRAYSANQLLTLAKHYQPDLVISDAGMPLADMAQTIFALKEETPQTRIIVIAEEESEEYVLKLLGAGIDGYTLKEDSPEMLVQAVQTVLQGGMWISPKSIKQIVGTLLPSCPNGRSTQSTLQMLSKREQEVLRLLAMGMENCEIADALCITKRTVQNHVSTVYQKICVKSRSQAILYAIKQGLVKY